ncbi:MAG: glutamate racemase [Candidatus Marinimicrobia bacterium]|jgi:glutamate racemase|nr:glutamate racemase [Candidatus Neomarinimicrobiota bacterium]
MTSECPIGVFDSGLGGLTVVKALRKHFPNESIVYLGDTARVPYGNKSRSTVQKYSYEIADFLLEKNVKAIVVACNTATALALEELKKRFSVPVIGVIQPGVKAAEEKTKNKKIGIIGTIATIQSGAYEKQFNSINGEINVTSQACPLLVPLAEDGWMKEKIVNDILTHYLEPLIKENIDTLVLGCTHYPVFSTLIGNVLGQDVTLIDSPAEVASVLLELLKENNLFTIKNFPGKLDCYVTDKTRSYPEIAERFLGAPVPNLFFTDLDKN